MPNFRRNWVPGGTFFFTVVSAGRAPLFRDESARTLLGASFRRERLSRPFAVDAIVLLPDHLHAIWTLPQGDADFSTRWARIKRSFTRAWVAGGGWEGGVSDSRRRNRRRGVWQRRFWEHVVRDQTDLARHLNYIHYNPIKHGLAECAHAWPWSSFHRLVRAGVYDARWCCGCDGDPGPMPHFDGLDTEGIELAFGE
jgi:putative transposase